MEKEVKTNEEDQLKRSEEAEGEPNVEEDQTGSGEAQDVKKETKVQTPKEDHTVIGSEEAEGEAKVEEDQTGSGEAQDVKKETKVQTPKEDHTVIGSEETEGSKKEKCVKEVQAVQGSAGTRGEPNVEEDQTGSGEAQDVKKETKVQTPKEDHTVIGSEEAEGEAKVEEDQTGSGEAQDVKKETKVQTPKEDHTVIGSEEAEGEPKVEEDQTGSGEAQDVKKETKVQTPKEDHTVIGSEEAEGSKKEKCVKEDQAVQGSAGTRGRKKGKKAKTPKEVQARVQGRKKGKKAKTPKEVQGGVQGGKKEKKVKSPKEDKEVKGLGGAQDTKLEQQTILPGALEEDDAEALRELTEKLSKISLSDDDMSDNSVSTSQDTQSTTALTTSTAGAQSDTPDLDLKTLGERVDAFLLHKDEYLSPTKELQQCGQEIEDLFIKHKDSLIKEDKIMYWLKLGQLFSITKKNKRLAIEPLSKVVTLNPNIKEVWNILADCYWHVGDYIMAQNCLEASLEQKREKEPLRNLSIVYRKLAMMDSEKRTEYTETGVSLAKEAVNKDLKDSISWGILGNAYLHAYFNLINEAKSAQLAISAYKQAVKLNTGRLNTELYYNQALANKYCEFYDEALLSLDMAIMQDKVWEPAMKLKCQLLLFLNNIQYFHNTKGKLRPKRINKYQKELVTIQGESYIQSLNLETKHISSLGVGKNNSVLVYGKVIWTLSQQESFPFTCGCVGASGECFVVLVYNVTPGRGFIIGDTLFVPEPNYKTQKFLYDSNNYEFPSIRVENPTNLIVNKKRLTNDYFTPYILITSEKEAT